VLLVEPYKNTTLSIDPLVLVHHYEYSWYFSNDPDSLHSGKSIQVTFQETGNVRVTVVAIDKQGGDEKDRFEATLVIK
jgi:hypothetical protein